MATFFSPHGWGRYCLEPWMATTRFEVVYFVCLSPEFLLNSACFEGKKAVLARIKQEFCSFLEEKLE